MLIGAIVLSVLIIVSSTIVAFLRPQWLSRGYRSVVKIGTWVVWVCILWVLNNDAGTIRLIRAVTNDSGRTSESALHSIQSFASDAIRTQMAFIGSSLALLVAIAYLAILAHLRRSTGAPRNAA